MARFGRIIAEGLRCVNLVDVEAGQIPASLERGAEGEWREL